MSKKYICFSNSVISSDGDIHFISARYLPQLYKVNPEECIIVNKERDLIGLDLNNFIHLNPKSDGNYYDAKDLKV